MQSKVSELTNVQAVQAKFKLRAVEFAVGHESRAAGKEFEVSKKMIQDWRNTFSVLHRRVGR